jgi:hypothetical protein
MKRSVPHTPHGAWWRAHSSKQERNRRESNPLSPASKLYSAALISSGLEPPSARPAHGNPPIPLFKIPTEQWPVVLQRVAQGESLRQIAKSYRTSYEAVRRVLQASRRELVEADDKPAVLNPETQEEAERLHP